MLKSVPTFLNFLKLLHIFTINSIIKTKNSTNKIMKYFITFTLLFFICSCKHKHKNSVSITQESQRELKDSITDEEKIQIQKMLTIKDNSKQLKKGNIETTKTFLESNQKLIEICKNFDGVLDADIREDILTIRTNITKNEAQKLSYGMLSEIKKYNQNINTVIVVDIGYNLLCYSGK